MTTQISNHLAQAKARLLGQYQGKPNVEKLVDTLFREIQPLENTFWALLNERSLDSAIGAQLDQLGTIVGIARVPGQTDDEYRVLLKAQILQNISQGEPETIIEILSLLIGGDVVVYLNEHGFGETLPFVSASLTEAQVNAFVRLAQRAMPAGSRVLALGYFWPDDAFAFDGPDAAGKGFGSTTDANAGGRLSYLQAGYGLPFALQGSDVESDGLGTISDAFLGGLLVGL